MKTKKIHYSNRVNQLVKNDNNEATYYPRITIKNKVEEAKFIELATKGKGISPEIFVASMDSMINTISEIIGNGGSFSSRWLSGQSCMKGSSASEDEIFDPSANTTHSISETLRLPSNVRENIFSEKNVKYIREQYLGNGPVIFEVCQFYPYRKDAIESGNTGRLRGRNLFCNEDEPESGVFITDSEGNKTKLNSDSQSRGNTVYFTIPKETTTGEYTLSFISSKTKDNHAVQVAHTITIE
ncbi:MAG: DUF4469 domain-containing protein [Hyphomicrobiales bacterium]